MDDARDRAVVEHVLQRVEVGDVAAHERHAVDVLAEHEPQAARVLPEVVPDHLVPIREDRAGDPRTEAAEHAGDEDSLAHASGASWYTVTASVKNSSAARPCS